VIAFVALRRQGRVSLARVTPVLACVLLGAQSLDAHAGEALDDGWYAGLDAGVSRLEPRNRDGGYRIDDKQSAGIRVELGYSWNHSWSVEAFYADGGKAGISSDNPAVGHLGDIEYKMSGVGLEWIPFDGGRNERWYPLVKLGAVQIRNRANSDQILYEKLNDVGVYLGGGVGLRLKGKWSAQAEVVSYDQDELFFTVGIRKRF
jgi:hypothetical protein